MKKNEGITLIALVITIIVLLILAGISIATLTGENGVLTKAQNSKEITRGRSVEEVKNIWKNEQKMDKYTETSTTQKLDGVLKDLREQNLITEEEETIIKNTGEITIGGIKIEFIKMITFTYGGKEATCFEGTTWGDLALLIWNEEKQKWDRDVYNAMSEGGIKSFVGTWTTVAMAGISNSCMEWIESKKFDVKIYVLGQDYSENYCVEVSDTSTGDKNKVQCWGDEIVDGMDYDVRELYL